MTPDIPIWDASILISHSTTRPDVKCVLYTVRPFAFAKKKKEENDCLIEMTFYRMKHCMLQDSFTVFVLCMLTSKS